jgi:transmembrane sensor
VATYDYDIKHKVSVHWDAQRMESTRVAMQRRRVARRRRAMVSSALVGAAAAWLCLARPAFTPEQRVSLASPTGHSALAVPAAESTRLADGSLITRLTEAASYEIMHARSDETLVRVQAGAVRFTVTPNPSRVFCVEAGTLAVRVLGTVFDVERTLDAVIVRVLRGRVEIRDALKRRVVGAGESARFPRQPAQQEPATTVAANDAPGEAKQAAQHAARSAPGRKAAQRPARWQDHARQGEFNQAFELIRRERQPVGSTLEELLLAADAARLSGHPAEAVPFLEQVVSKYKHDARAMLAAFTLGRIQLDNLGEPARAAASFALVERTATRVSLVEDASVRRIEALHRAGDRAGAALLAAEYLRRYPDGSHGARVRRFLEPKAD